MRTVFFKAERVMTCESREEGRSTLRQQIADLRLPRIRGVGLEHFFSLHGWRSVSKRTIFSNGREHLQHNSPSGARSKIECAGTNIKFTLVDQEVPAISDIKFRLSTRNPAETPPLFKNFWRVYHLMGDVIGQNIATPPPLLDPTFQKHLSSSDAYESWDILPQLMNLHIRLGILNNAARAAGSRTDIEFVFMPVSQADEVRIWSIQKRPSQESTHFSKQFFSLPYIVVVCWYM